MDRPPPPPARGIGRLRPASLTARLVATAVTLVAVVCLVVTVATTLTMRQYLTARLDDQVSAALQRATAPRPDPSNGDGDEREGTGDRPGLARNPIEDLLGQGGGTLLAVLGSAGGDGVVVPAEPGAALVRLTSQDLTRLSSVPRDGEGHDLAVGGLETSGDGEGRTRYRVQAVRMASGSTLVVGLPPGEVDDTVRNTAQSGLLLTLLGVLLAAASGRVVVRRQLRPLREVAATADEVSRLPLGSGASVLPTRVPQTLADGRTEVGQVGAALNTMLGHVESALDERHRSEQRVRQFVADASHELRTPLTTIQGYAELSRRTPDDPERLGAALAKVESESARMAALVEDLLLLARLDSGRPLERAEVDVTRLLLEAVADARVVAPGHRWRLDLPDEALEVTGDELRLHQVVTNLLNNARRHTPEGTTVTAGARSAGHVVRVTVHDDGPGLPPALVDRAFERFTRGDSSRTRASGGAGLGLSLVQAIAAAHGGAVTVSSTPGSTTFTLDLPR